ncbi:hypothetical protein KVT40_002792 [Elsinoe batatas]|uniref:Uncharacterized protein n=1 Tax=Elsinoe batatas TaxID=2601811 RepID=A0A8K0L4D2_9PEZI|nr:hypothetical protein KVT40_002792 [Elsinoe batatas]
MLCPEASSRESQNYQKSRPILIQSASHQSTGYRSLTTRSTVPTYPMTALVTLRICISSLPAFTTSPAPRQLAQPTADSLAELLRGCHMVPNASAIPDLIHDRGGPSSTALAEAIDLRVAAAKDNGVLDAHRALYL